MHRFVSSAKMFEKYSTPSNLKHLYIFNLFTYQGHIILKTFLCIQEKISYRDNKWRETRMTTSISSEAFEINTES